MNQVIHSPAVKTMSSVELVEVINELRPEGSAELRHDTFVTKIEKHPGIDAPKFSGTQKYGNGNTRKVYNLPKRECELMVMSESLAVQTRVYDRMSDLEQQVAQPAFVIPKTMSEALRLAADLADTVQTLQIETASQQKIIEVVQPKADALDLISTFAEGSMCLTNAAKVLQVQPKRFFAWLQENMWIYRRAGGSGFIGYQNRIQVGYLDHKVTTVERSDGTTKQVEQVLVTAKGLSKLALSFAAPSFALT